MKRCPECRRDYFDDSLSYCLDDGTVLLEGPSSGSGDEPPTAVIHQSQSPSRANDLTRTFTNGDSKSGANSIVVLPFANLSRDEDAEYLSDGLAEELLNVLSRIDGLRVAGRTSSFAFKGKSTSFDEIGRLLNVSSVLEGSVRMAGKRVRISVQLVNISDGFQLWSGTYDRTTDDIFEIQDDIAQAVVGELRSRLIDRSVSPDLRRGVAAEVADAAKGRAQDPEVHRLILLGRHLIDRKTKADMSAAIGYFQQALDLDPENALCWALLGRAHFLTAAHSWEDLSSAGNKARDAVEKALAIDPDLAEGYALLGRMQFSFEWDFRRAEASLRRARELAPDDPFVQVGASQLELNLGRFDEALVILRQALLIDPLNITVLATLGYSANAAGSLDEAVTAHRRLLEIMPNRASSRAFLSLVLLDQGKFNEALAEASAEPDENWRLWAVAIIENAAGNRKEALETLEEYILNWRDGSAFQIAEVYSSFGNPDEAFNWLDTAVAQRDPGMTTLKWSPHLRPLHSDPRWLPLLKTVGFPEE